MDESGKKIVLPYKLSAELYAAEEKARHATMRQSRVRLLALKRMRNEEEKERPLTAEEKEIRDDMKRSYEALVPLLEGRLAAPFKRMDIEIPPVMLGDDLMQKQIDKIFLNP